MANRPQPEIDVDENLVRELLVGQFPDLADHPVALLSRGWDNTTYRLGTRHLVRLPHRHVADQLVVNEQRWLPAIADRVDLGVPAPTHRGEPTAAYPWHWSITPYFEGHEAATTPLADPSSSAAVLARFFAQLHTRASADAPVNPFRGTALADQRSAFDERLGGLHPSYDKRDIVAVFDRAAGVEPSRDRVWLHGDLHTRNIIVGNGRLVAVIDWGDICAGDRATDLAAAYMLVPDDLDVVMAQARVTEADWLRARGWACHFAIAYLANSDDDQVMHEVGTRLLAAVMG